MHPPSCRQLSTRKKFDTFNTNISNTDMYFSYKNNMIQYCDK